MTRGDAIKVLEMIDTYGVADEAKMMAIEALQTVQKVITCKYCDRWHEGYCCVHRIITGEKYYCGSAEKKDNKADYRDEIKSTIIKSLETAKDFELVEAYATLVSCGSCPYWRKCQNEHECDEYIADKLKEGE